MARTMPTGLLGMIRADSLSALADGASVTSWADTVGTRVLVTRNAAPTKVASGANGQPAVRFNGNSQDLKMDGPPIVAQPNSIFVVLTARSITATERAILWQGGQDIGIANNGAPAIWAGTFLSSSLTVSANAPAVVTFLADGAADSAIYVNGAQGAKANVGTGALDGNLLTIGSHGTIGSRYMEMDLYELRIYDHDLTAAERQVLHSYAQDRYAITVSDYVADVVPGIVNDRWDGTNLIRMRSDRWDGTNLIPLTFNYVSSDVTAPTVPANVVATANSATQVTITWSASTDAVGVSSYRVRRNGVDLVGATALTGTSFVDTSVAEATGYSYTVSAIDAAGNRSAESTAAAATTPATVVTPITPAGSSTPARWWITYGGAPHARVTWETSVNSSGKAQVVWVGSFPDTRARTSPRETGVSAQSQAAYQAYIVDSTNSTTVADSGVVTGTAESWEATGFTPVAGRTYFGYAKVRSTDGQWSPVAFARFVAPTGVVRYFETYGAVGDGTTNDQSAVRQAIDSANPGDVIKSNAPGVVLTDIASTGTALSSTAVVFNSGMVGKKVMVYGGGKRDATADAALFRTTISAVAADGKSATLAAAVQTGQAAAKVIVGYREFLVGHEDIDGGLGGNNASRGGHTIDGTGCLFTSNNPDSAGFRTTLPNVTYRNVHYWTKGTFTRGNGLNGNTGPFFTEGANAVGVRFIGCYAERARDAGFLIYNACADVHVVDCVTDHCMADPFHVTGSAHDIQFIRPTAIWAGDDVTANIGYRSDGDANRPYNIIWESPKMYGQDWGRGLSFGGSRDCLATDIYFDGGAMASFIIGSDGDMANTEHVQIRRFTIINPHARYNMKPVYTQGAATGSVITDGAWLKLLNSGSATPQKDILIEDGTITDGWQLQVISYGGGTFLDSTVILRGIVMNGAVNAGLGWADDGTYPGHIDLRGISVPAGSTAASAPPNGSTP